MRLRTVAVAVLCWLALASCVEPSSGAPSSDDLAQFGVESTVVVDLDEDGFDPSSLELAANSTITVINVGATSHGARQVDTQADRRIDSGDLLPGESVAIHLADPGAVELIDHVSGETLTLEVGPPTSAD
jgi:plastocyanin